MLIKALHIIEAYLGSRIHVVHVPRVSNWESEVADNLSRERTTGFLEKQMLNRPQKKNRLAGLNRLAQKPGGGLDNSRPISRSCDLYMY
ncbi:MAG: hypothetical protein ACK56I_23045, partial [bacterium]